ncbi:Proteasome inhibitor PI31 subunit [Bagarius yarrelli]|uniref:Proteasome inhibitor PI31 subunit n=1 Tax=Bagarius yarrelli TaxID=175774 RepID=A0A556V899_BAGYA|nr:Proteasome inhibitor PI31 subunit [Bagarius yarrelli]
MGIGRRWDETGRRLAAKAMAGMEVLYNSVASSITSPQDAIVCFIHWEIVKSGYKCLGSGDKPLKREKKSELLPASWNLNKELYTLRYRSNDDKSNLLIKAIKVDSGLIFNLMDSATDKVTDLTVNVGDYVNEANLQSFESGTSGGMIVDPLRAGFPRSGFDPSSGIPGVLPPGAVPPGARFDPFGPVGRHGTGPDPDHLPPPDYDDMFM